MKHPRQSLRLELDQIVPFCAGFGFSLFAFQSPPLDLGLRRVALELPPTWVGACLFYLIPLVLAYSCSVGLCRLLERGELGASLVLGSAVFSLIVGALGFEAYQRCPLYGGCGTGRYLWYSATAAIPAFIGKVLAWRAWRRRPQ